jgi:hypothetical protein
MPPRLIEFRVRGTGEEIIAMPLYDFLRELHACSPKGEFIPFDALEILVDGEEVTPCECGHA